MDKETILGECRKKENVSYGYGGQPQVSLENLEQILNAQEETDKMVTIRLLREGSKANERSGDWWHFDFVIKWLDGKGEQ